MDRPETGPSRLAGRRTRVPVYVFEPEAGAPEVWALRITREAVEHVDFRSHVHDFPGLVYFERRCEGLSSGGHPFPIEAGDGVLVRPGELIEIDDWEELVDARGWSVYFTFDAVTGSRDGERTNWRGHPLLRPFSSTGAAPTRFQVPPGERAQFEACLAAIEREVRQRQDGYRHAVAAQLTLLLVSIARLVGEPTRDVPGQDLLDRVLAVIDARFAEPLSLAEVAEAVHLNASHLTTRIREATGRTVQEWIVERRMVQARRLLTETELPIHRVAARCGYDDAGYFGRVFRQTQGTSPTAWRRAH